MSFVLCATIQFDFQIIFISIFLLIETIISLNVKIQLPDDLRKNRKYVKRERGEREWGEWYRKIIAIQNFLPALIKEKQRATFALL